MVVDPDFVAKWCTSRNYRLEPRAPTRKDLQEIAETNRQDLLDRRLVHVEARNFYYQLLTFKTLVGRAVLNWETMMAFTLDDWTLNLVKEGKVRSHDVTVIPLIFRAKGWAEERHFTWSDKLPTVKDLLAKKKASK